MKKRYGATVTARFYADSREELLEMADRVERHVSNTQEKLDDIYVRAGDTTGFGRLDWVEGWNPELEEWE